MTIYRDASGWVLEREGAREPLPAGAVVIAAGRRFTLHLPDLVARTVDAAAAPLTLEALTLTFRVSRDEELIALTASDGARTVDLGARAQHALTSDEPLPSDEPVPAGPHGGPVSAAAKPSLVRAERRRSGDVRRSDGPPNAARPEARGSSVPPPRQG